jgi:hypothetical protein
MLVFFLRTQTLAQVELDDEEKAWRIKQQDLIQGRAFRWVLKRFL